MLVCHGSTGQVRAYDACRCVGSSEGCRRSRNECLDRGGDLDGLGVGMFGVMDGHVYQGSIGPAWNVVESEVPLQPCIWPMQDPDFNIYKPNILKTSNL